MWCREPWTRSHAAGPDLVSTRRQVQGLCGHDATCLLRPYPVGGQRLRAFTVIGPCGGSGSFLIREAGSYGATQHRSLPPLGTEASATRPYAALTGVDPIL
jgi:hypothetical protein